MNEIEARKRVYSVVAKTLGLPADQTGFTYQDEKALDGLLAIWKVPADVTLTSNQVNALLPFRYVIPDQDLKLVETVFSVLTAAAGAGYFFPSIGHGQAQGLVTSITGVIVAVLSLLHNLKQAVHLDSRDYAIMALLSHAGQSGLSAQDLLKHLHVSMPEMTSDDIEQRLVALAVCATVNGTKTSIVWKNDAGNWHSNGV